MQNLRNILLVAVSALVVAACGTAPAEPTSTPYSIDGTYVGSYAISFADAQGKPVKVTLDVWKDNRNTAAKIEDTKGTSTTTLPKKSSALGLQGPGIDGHLYGNESLSIRLDFGDLSLQGGPGTGVVPVIRSLIYDGKAVSGNISITDTKICVGC